MEINTENQLLEIAESLKLDIENTSSLPNLNSDAKDMNIVEYIKQHIQYILKQCRNSKLTTKTNAKIKRLDLKGAHDIYYIKEINYLIKEEYIEKMLKDILYMEKLHLQLTGLSEIIKENINNLSSEAA